MRAPKPTGIALKIEGEGVGLADIPLRHLVELLEATAATVEAVAAEKNLQAPSLSLASAAPGSAIYNVVSAAPHAKRVIDALVTVARKRGKDSSPQVRAGLLRMHKAGSRTGALTLIPCTGGGKTAGARKPVLVAAPVAEDETKVEEGTTIFGKVIGINVDSHERASVTLRLDDGGSGEFAASEDLLATAAGFITRHVEAQVTYLRGDSRDFPATIESLVERRPQSSFATAMRELRQSLIARGITFSAREAIEEEDDHGDDDRPDGDPDEAGDGG